MSRDDRSLGRRSVLAALTGVTVGCGGRSRPTGTDTVVTDHSTGTSSPTPSTSRSSQTADPDEYDIDEPVETTSVWIEPGTDTDGTGRPDRIEVYVVRPESPTDDRPAVVRADPYDIASQPIDVTTGIEGVAPPDPPTDVYGSFDVELFVPDTDRRFRSDPGREPLDALTETGQDSTAPRGVVGELSVDRSFDTAAHVGSSDTGRTADVGTQAGIGFVEQARRAYVRLFVPAGYAYVDVSPVGTGRSTGCNGFGDAAEAASVTATIDWLNDRRPAYTTRDGDTTAAADWASGDAGMVGQSYLGTIQNNVAVTGVDGLRTIVPKASRVSRYLGQRSHGAVAVGGPSREPSPVTAATWTTGVNKHRCGDVLDRLAEQVDWDTGNFNDFWADRAYVADFDELETSVLFVHTLRDHTQSPRQLAAAAEALRAHDVPHRLWVGQGDHGAVPNLRDRYAGRWKRLLLDWFDYWVKGESNGVMDGPTAVVETPFGRLAGEDGWPTPRREVVSFRTRPGDPFGTLTTDETTVTATASFVDNSEVSPSTLVDEPGEHAVGYRTKPLDGPVRVSGTVRPRVTVSVDSTAALLSGAVVEYQPGSDGRIVSRGWANLTNHDGRCESDPLKPGRRYDVSFALNPTEHVFSAGNRLGIVVYSSDSQFTKRPPSSPMLTLHLDDTTFDVPVVDGRRGLTDPPDSSAALYGDPPFE